MKLEMNKTEELILPYRQLEIELPYESDSYFIEMAASGKVKFEVLTTKHEAKEVVGFLNHSSYNVFLSKDAFGIYKPPRKLVLINRDRTEFYVYIRAYKMDKVETDRKLPIGLSL